MIKFEADPVVGYKQREARSDGGIHSPRISIKWRRRAPKRLVSLLRFLRYLNTLAVDPMRRSLTAVIPACHRSNMVRSTGHLSHVFPSLHYISPLLPCECPSTVSVPRPSARLHFPHMLYIKSILLFSPTPRTAHTSRPGYGNLHS